MAQDLKGNLCKDLYLGKKEQSSKILNTSLTPESTAKEENEVTIREQEINYSLSNLIENLRLESDDKASSAKVENRTSFKKHSSPDITESTNNLSSSKCDEKMQNTGSLIKREKNEISFSLSDKIKKMTIGSDSLLPLKMEKVVYKSEMNSYKHYSDKQLNNLSFLEGEEKVLEARDSNIATEKYYGFAAILELETNIERTCMPNGKLNLCNSTWTQSTSEKENYTPFRNQYSNKNGVFNTANKNNMASMDNKDISDTTDDKLEKCDIKKNKIIINAEKRKEFEELTAELIVHEASGKNNGSYCKNKETPGVKIYEKDCWLELQSYHSLKKDNNNMINYSYSNDDAEKEKNMKSTVEYDESKKFICNCNLDAKTKHKESNKDIENSDEAFALVKNDDGTDFDNSKEAISDGCDKNKANVNEESDENQEKANREFDNEKENIIGHSKECKNNVSKYSVEEKEIVNEKADENQEKVSEESKINKENVIGGSNEYKNKLNEYSPEEQENVIEGSDENREKVNEEFDKNEENIVEVSSEYNEYSDDEEENVNEESDEDRENDVEEFDKDRENEGEESDEDQENDVEESDEDQENDIEELVDQIRPRGPVKTLVKTHTKKPYPTKREAHDLHAVASSVSTQRINRFSMSSETPSDDYSNASYSDSGYTSSPSTSHSYDDLEENANEKNVDDELSELHDEISNFLQSNQTPEYLNSIENTFGELSLDNYSTTHVSYEDTLRERNILANEILENVFDSETLIQDFAKRSSRKCQIRANSNLSFNDDSYNESLLEMFDNEAILQTVEANVNSRVNLLPNETNFNSFETLAFRTISPTNTLPITQIENSNSKELPAGLNISGIENLSNNNTDETNSMCIPNTNECSSGSLSNNFGTPVENAQNENVCNSSNSRKKSVSLNKTKKKQDSSTGTFSKQESSQIPLKCKNANGFSKQILRSILHNEKLLLSLGKYYKRIRETKNDVIYVTELRGSKGKHLNLTNLHIAVINSDLEEIYAIVEIHKQYNKTFADINRKDIFGKTVLDYAIDKGNQVVIDYLIENTAKQSIVIGKKT